jgi:leucyl aminopeptidase
VTGTVRVSASAADSDSGISKVVFYVDGNARATVTAAPYRFNWNTANFTTGTHTLTAIATDVAGNRTQSAPVTVTSS